MKLAMALQAHFLEWRFARFGKELLCNSQDAIVEIVPTFTALVLWWAYIDFCVCLLLFYTIATVFQLSHGGDMIYEMRRRKPEPTFVPTQGAFNLQHHIGMV